MDAACIKRQQEYTMKNLILGNFKLRNKDQIFRKIDDINDLVQEMEKFMDL